MQINHKQMMFKAGVSYKKATSHHEFVVVGPAQNIDHKKLLEAISISTDEVDPCNVCVSASGYCSDCPICHGLDCQVIAAAH